MPIKTLGEGGRDCPEESRGPGQLEALIAAVPLAVLVVDLEGCVRRWNPAAEQLFGWCAAEVLGHPIPCIPEADRAAFVAELGGIPQAGVVRQWQRRDGNPVDIRRWTMRWRTAEGAVVGSAEIIVDITDRRRAEEALRVRTEQLEAIRTVSEEILQERELPSLLALIHRRATEMLGTGTGTVYAWDEASRFLISQVRRGRGASTREFRLRLGEGVVGTVAERREGMVVNDFRTSPYATPRLLAETGHCGLVAEPLIYRERLLGAISVDTADPDRRFTEQDRQLLRLFAAQAAIAIENARLFEAAQRELRERNRAEEKLRATLQRLHDIIEFLPDPTFVIDQDRKVIAWNRAMEQLSGAMAEEMLGQGDYAYALPFYRERRPILIDLVNLPTAEVEARYAYVRRVGDKVYAEAYAPHMNEGAGVHLWGVASPLYDVEGRRIGAIEVIRDTTERKRAEEALTARTHQLETLRSVSEEITRELDPSRVLKLIHTRAVELVRGDSGVIYLWDEAAQALVPAHWHGHGDWVADVRMRLGEGAAGAVAARREGLIVNDFRTSPYATPVWLERSRHTAALLEPLCYRNGLVGVLTVARDDPADPFSPEDQRLLRLLATQAAIAIENARLFAELNDSYAHLQTAQAELIQSEKLRALGQLAAGVAHDLNNTLAAILGQVELLTLQKPPLVIGEGLATIETAAADGAQVVRRLQDFGRQRPTIPLQPCDLAPIVREALALTRPRWADEAQRRGQRITVQTHLEDLPLILGHPSEIREALTNLIFNAVDAMPAGGTLTVTGVPTPEGVSLHVADTGMGMAAVVRQRLFEPFFTTKGMQGTGLGLSVVYGIMERHRGRIDVSSAPGQGTTVILLFQAAEARGEAAAPIPPRPLVPRRLLLIDDDPLVRASLRDLLRVSGHTVLTAESGAAGLAALAETTVDCVITDLGMPEMTGWEVARTLKGRTPPLPVILLTGWGEQAEQEAETLRVVDRVLGKPVHLQALLACVAEVTEPRGG